MKRFIEGADRIQSMPLPECLDDWVDDSNSVRTVDARRLRRSVLMPIRKRCAAVATVEHPFGTLQMRMGVKHFLDEATEERGETERVVEQKLVFLLLTDTALLTIPADAVKTRTCLESSVLYQAAGKSGGTGDSRKSPARTEITARA